VKKPNKRHLLQSLLEIPNQNKRNFWAREMKLLNDLLSGFSNMEFWTKVKFTPKPNSLLFFKTESGLSLLKKKYNEFNYKIPKRKTIPIGKIVGENRSYTRKPKTIKDFLGE
jgi:hypothetical protein